MSSPSPFDAGPRLTSAPIGDPLTQAVASLRGYGYQLYASALAWADLKSSQELYLEVARDYAIAANNAISAVEVKDTAASNVTINSEDVRENLDAFVDLVERNPGRQINLRFLSTSSISRERSLKARVNGEASLLYWRRAAANADVAPLRDVLLQTALTPRVRKFIELRDADSLREDLLRRIHWDCGQHAIDGLIAELEANLARLSMDRLNAPFAETKRLTAVVLQHVLMTIINSNGLRRLTELDLLSVLDEATKVTLTRRSFDALTNAVADSFTDDRSGFPVDLVSLSRILEPESSVPLPRILAQRDGLSVAVSDNSRRHGATFLTGSTGSGKTIVARLAARRIGADWDLIDFRDLSTTETTERIEFALGSLSQSKRTGLILDDLNEIESPSVRRALAYLLAALRRRDSLCFVTSYLEPSARVLAELGITRDAILAVPDLTVEEVGEMIAAAEGDGLRWANAVYVGGGFGHPQLIQAIISGLRSRSWPASERSRLLSFERSADVEAERLATRRQLVAAVPVEASTILYRVSLLIGRFDRALALRLGEIDPSVANPGAQLDNVIGPWIEQVGNDQLRISPLLQNAGHEILTPSSQQLVHLTAAEEILSARSIKIDKANATFLHAVLGKSAAALMKLAYGVIKADRKERKLLSEWMPALRLQRFDHPIYSEQPRLALLLRFAQLLLVATTGNDSSIRKCWAAIQRALEAEEDHNIRSHFEYFITAKILFDQDAAGLLPDWIDIIFRFERLSDSDPEREKLWDAMKVPSQGILAPTPIGMLFIVQSLGVPSVRDLMGVFDKIDQLNNEQRAKLFADATKMPSDFSLIVNRPWLAEHIKDAVKALANADSYRVMADQAQAWGCRELSIRCHVARGIMLDEYALDPNAALNALQEAQTKLDDDPVLVRARAKVLYRRKDHKEALSLIRDVAERAEINNPTERTFMLREAAISAAETGEWGEARKWFLAARSAAIESPGLVLNAMNIGLRADEALAAYKCGDLNAALSGLDLALEELVAIKADSSIATGYRHRVVRHSVLWLFGQVTGNNVSVDGQPNAMVPGMCSNPEPTDLSDMPLGSADYVRYLLAEVEIWGNAEAGIDKGLKARLRGQAVPAMELGLRHARITRSIRNLDAAGFSSQLVPWIEAQLYLISHGSELRAGGPLNPTYGEIDNVTREQLNEPVAITNAADSILSFGIGAALSQRTDVLEALALHIGQTLPLSTAYSLSKIMASGKGGADQFDDSVAKQIHKVANRNDLVPDELFLAGVRFAQSIKRSSYKKALAVPLGNWARQIWKTVIAEQQFYLRNPSVTVPLIRQALESPEEGLGFLGKLFIASQPAVKHRFDSSFREYLKTLGD
jgi:hypothetical protein